ncbi:MAG: protein-L-isoaspartate(D-aspartate) O-methyltransferase [Desulfobacterales bacterium]|nr:protein-L-isoaspartate(D-aspartate) O-methyltransferase [Desulfobacterales bacterium]MCP4159767.1 protein-L-isoaspartate(D-aspartate) O-methyltransferase [Deltaproteobacteria bacterium]
MINKEQHFEKMREDMVNSQLAPYGINDPKVLKAMGTVPRHLFVEEALMDQAYGDFPLPIGEQQTISQPRIVAEMTQALKIDKNSRVLEIGTGSGYQAAILSRIAYKVYTIERINSLYVNARKLFDKLKYHNIVTKYTDGTIGWNEESPFDAIIVTAGAPKIPDELINQLKDGGKMVIPVGDKRTQNLLLLEKNGSSVNERNLGACRFVNLIGKDGW